MQRLKFEKVYLDTNAIIHAVENYSHVAREILRAGQRGEISLFTSAITLHETMIGPLARGSVQLGAQYHGALLAGDGIEIVDLDNEALMSAAHLRAAHKRLDMADAFHIASIEIAECEYFISEDAGLDEFLPETIERLSLSELTIIEEVQ